ncbi:MAG: putative Lipoprotein TraT related [Nitrospira sp.]|nr:putative Lipoprotein TraT related [Nitrospira sp.]
MTDRMNAKLSITTRMLLLVALLEMAGCSNVLRSGLVNDNSILLPPSAERSIYVQIRNTSENQAATPSDIPARLSAKGYRIVTDPLQAAYWLKTQVVYCHKAGEGVRPETVAKAGFGSGIGSGGTALARSGASDVEAMGAMFSGMPGGAMNTQAMRAMAMGGSGMPDMNALMRMAMSGRGGYPEMAEPQQEEGMTYLCVADVLVTERGTNGQPRTYTMRSVAHVLQKSLNIEEATPIVQDKFTASITGPF